MPDSSGYPTEEELAELDAFRGTPRDLVDAVDELWWHDGFSMEPIADAYLLRLSTWGWSGNEEIIEHLQRSWFWFFFWAMSRRGGHFEFEIGDHVWKEALPVPFLVVPT